MCNTFDGDGTATQCSATSGRFLLAFFVGLVFDDHSIEFIPSHGDEGNVTIDGNVDVLEPGALFVILLEPTIFASVLKQLLTRIEIVQDCGRFDDIGFHDVLLDLCIFVDALNFDLVIRLKGSTVV